MIPLIEYHVQEFEEGERGGWYALLQTADRDEAIAYKASLDAENHAYQLRIMTVTLVPIDEPDHLRIAARKTLEGLYLRVPGAGGDIVGPSSIGHISWMLNQIDRKLDVWPVDKTSRWIGYVQGLLTAKGLLDVQAERDRTRPIFHEAYASLGYMIPETLENPDG